MDKPRHPHVIRTWAVERTRHSVRNIPGIRMDTPMHGAPRSLPVTRSPKAGGETKEK